LELYSLIMDRDKGWQIPLIHQAAHDYYYGHGIN
jgi:hypothetical protein